MTKRKKVIRRRKFKDIQYNDQKKKDMSYKTLRGKLKIDWTEPHLKRDDVRYIGREVVPV
jgi:hypothetical protein